MSEIFVGAQKQCDGFSDVEKLRQKNLCFSNTLFIFVVFSQSSFVIFFQHCGKSIDLMF